MFAEGLQRGDYWCEISARSLLNRPLESGMKSVAYLCVKEK